MATIKVKTANGREVIAKVISDIGNYRGFWVKVGKTYIIPTFNTQGFNLGYSLGFDTEGKSIFEYLYKKLERGEKLTAFEKESYFEKLSPVKTVVQHGGVWYCFEDVLVDHPSFNNVHLLEETPCKEEMEYLREHYPYLKKEILMNKEVA